MTRSSPSSPCSCARITNKKIRTLGRVLILYRKNPVNFTFTGFFLVEPVFSLDTGFFRRRLAKMWTTAGMMTTGDRVARLGTHI